MGAATVVLCPDTGRVDLRLTALSRSFSPVNDGGESTRWCGQCGWSTRSLVIDSPPPGDSPGANLPPTAPRSRPRRTHTRPRRSWPTRWPSLLAPVNDGGESTRWCGQCGWSTRSLVIDSPPPGDSPGANLPPTAPRSHPRHTHTRPKRRRSRLAALPTDVCRPASEDRQRCRGAWGGWRAQRPLLPR